MNRGNWYWPDLSDIDGAKDATHLGMWCAIIVSGVTALFALIAFWGRAHVMGISASAMVDAALFAAIAFGISKYSRVAAVAGLVLFFLEKAYALITTGNILGVGVLGVILLIGFLNGARGAFAYHKFLTAAAVQPQELPPTPVPNQP